MWKPEPCEGTEKQDTQEPFQPGEREKFLQANDLSKVEAIFLLHLSDGN
jgi:hypothetical protein